MTPWSGVSSLTIVYPIFALFLLGVVLAAVPRIYIRRLFLISLLLGFLASWLLALFCGALNIFKYQHAGPFAVAGSPIFLNLAWSPAILLYLYFQPPLEQKWRFRVYLAIWSLLSAMLDIIFHKLGMLRYIHWSPYHRFVIAFLLFLTASWYHHQMARTGWAVDEKP